MILRNGRYTRSYDKVPVNVLMLKRDPNYVHAPLVVTVLPLFYNWYDTLPPIIVLSLLNA